MSEVRKIGERGEIAEWVFREGYWVADVNVQDRSRLELLLEKIVETGHIPQGNSVPDEYQILVQRLLSARGSFLERNWGDFPLSMVEDSFFYAVAIRCFQPDQLPDVTYKPRSRKEGRLLAIVALRAAIQAASEKDADSIQSYAKRALAYTQESDEDLRDEAMNLLAYAKVQLEDYEGASRALQTALLGELNENLVINAVQVAAQLDAERSLHLSATLIERAPSIEMKLSIAHAALDRFSSSPDDDDDIPTLPTALADALYPLLCAPTISEEDFFSLLSAVCRVDENEIIRSEGLAKSPYAKHPGTAFYLAKRGKTILDVLDELAAVFTVYEQKNLPDWLILQRDVLVFVLLGFLSPSAKDEMQAAGAVLALKVIDKGIPIPSSDCIFIVCAAAATVADIIDPRSGQVSDAIVEKLIWACTYAPKVADGDFDLVGFSVLAAEAVQYSLIGSVAFNAGELSKAIEGIPRWRINKDMFRIQLKEWYDDLLLLRPYVGEKARIETDKLLRALNEFSTLR